MPFFCIILKEESYSTTGLNVATCGVANATGFGPLATNFSLLVASLATAISSYYFILFYLGGVYKITARFSFRGEMKSCTMFT